MDRNYKARQHDMGAISQKHHRDDKKGKKWSIELQSEQINKTSPLRGMF
jgi:hypothetical protein